MKPVMLIEVLRQPEKVATLCERAWEILIPQARAAGLLARLGVLLEAQGLLEQVPAQPRAYLEGARMLAVQHAASMRWEVHAIAQALSGLEIPVVLLKGAAYLVSGLPSSVGRMFSDLDIMVPRQQLSAVEAAMMRAGWISTHLDDYDQRYYREWMHELPPMIHNQRLNVVDIHHAIVPLTSRFSSPSGPLFEASQVVSSEPCLRVLSPIDMVIHSATHLFLEGEFEHGLRDLVDLDGLIRHFQTKDAQFWPEFVSRAKALGLWRPAAYALRYCNQVLGTPIPETVLVQAEAALGSWLGRMLRDQAFIRALKPFHPSCWDMLTPAILWGLYVRGHWLRMPMRQLIPHLYRKATMRHPDDEDAEQGDDQKA